MDEALGRIARSFYDVTEPPALADEEFASIISKTTIGLFAGGSGTRFRHITGQDDINKNAHLLPNGKSMIEMTVDLYVRAGFTHFVALVNHAADSVKEALGDGLNFGQNVRIEYSYDPGPVGKSGALLNALVHGFIPKDNYLITVNTDDLVFEFDEYPRHLIETHIDGESRGNLVTLGTYPTRDFPGSALFIQNGQVKDVKFHVDLPVPIHSGVTVFSPGAYEYFEKLFSLEENIDFESNLLPVLAKEGKLGAASFPKGLWIPVNEEKMYKKLIEYIDSH